MGCTLTFFLVVSDVWWPNIKFSENCCLKPYHWSNMKEILYVFSFLVLYLFVKVRLKSAYNSCKEFLLNDEKRLKWMLMLLKDLKKSKQDHYKQINIFYANIFAPCNSSILKVTKRRWAFWTKTVSFKTFHSTYSWQGGGGVFFFRFNL